MQFIENQPTLSANAANYANSQLRTANRYTEAWIQPYPEFRQYCHNPERFACRARLLAELVNLSNALRSSQWVRAEALLQAFGQALNAYLTLSNASFGQAPHDPQADQEDKFAALVVSTRQAMQFSDRYCRGTPMLQMARPALDALAQSLETRFVVEDELAVELADPAGSNRH